MATHLKIISYNIHKGLSAVKTRSVLEQIRDAIRVVGADVVFLQEVRGNHAGQSPQFEYLADEIWPHYSYGKNAIYQKGDHGNAILSKFPFTEKMNLDISNHALESRGLLYGKVTLAPCNRTLHLICLHLDLSSWGRNRQIQKVMDWVKFKIPAEDPLIIAGDFNDWKEKLSYPLIKHLNLVEVFFDSRGDHARTFPSFFPILKMDRIYVRGLQIAAAQCLYEPPWTSLSDHLAIYSDLIYD